jgi:predicted amidophosphoribosyltransferase
MSSPLRISESLPAIREYLLQAIFPEPCLHCKSRLSDENLLCPQCLSLMPQSEQNSTVPEAHYQTQYLYAYEGVQKSLFKAAKFSARRRAQAKILAMARHALQTLAEPGTLFLPMPSSRSFLSELLSSTVDAQSVQAGVFEMKKGIWGEKNKHLGEAARFRRIRESLVRSPKPLRAADRYVLCDDVLTTGATLGQAAWLLESSGVPREKILLWALFYRRRENDGPL